MDHGWVIGWGLSCLCPRALPGYNRLRQAFGPNGAAEGWPNNPWLHASQGLGSGGTRGGGEGGRVLDQYSAQPKFWLYEWEPWVRVRSLLSGLCLSRGQKPIKLNEGMKTKASGPLHARKASVLSGSIRQPASLESGSVKCQWANGRVSTQARVM